MQTDMMLVAGVVLGLLAFSSLVNAYSESRMPRLAAVLLVVSGGLVLGAVTQRPGGYSIGKVPDAVIRVIAHFLN